MIFSEHLYTVINSKKYEERRFNAFETNVQVSLSSSSSHQAAKKLRTVCLSRRVAYIDVYVLQNTNDYYPCQRLPGLLLEL